MVVSTCSLMRSRPSTLQTTGYVWIVMRRTDYLSLFANSFNRTERQVMQETLRGCLSVSEKPLSRLHWLYPCKVLQCNQTRTHPFTDCLSAAGQAKARDQYITLALPAHGRST